MREELKNRTDGIGSVTYNEFQNTLMEVLEQSGATLHNNAPPNQTAKVRQEAIEINHVHETLPHYWDGRFRRVPNDFRFSNCRVRQLWFLWVCGNSANRLSPYRLLEY